MSGQCMPRFHPASAPRLGRVTPCAAHCIVGRPGYKPARSWSDEPCPFCGAVEVLVSRVLEWSDEGPGRDADDIINGFESAMIHECVKCGASLTLDVESL